MLTALFLAAAQGGFSGGGGSGMGSGMTVKYVAPTYSKSYCAQNVAKLCAVRADDPNLPNYGNRRLEDTTSRRRVEITWAIALKGVWQTWGLPTEDTDFYTTPCTYNHLTNGCYGTCGCGEVLCSKCKCDDVCQCMGGGSETKPFGELWFTSSQATYLDNVYTERAADASDATFGQYCPLMPEKIPTAEPTDPPTTAEPTANPTAEPTNSPTDPPTTAEPTANPTAEPTNSPSDTPTTADPTANPTAEPTNSNSPTNSPTSAEIGFDGPFEEATRLGALSDQDRVSVGGKDGNTHHYVFSNLGESCHHACFRNAPEGETWYCDDQSVFNTDQLTLLDGPEKRCTFPTQDSIDANTPRTISKNKSAWAPYIRDDGKCFYAHFKGKHKCYPSHEGKYRLCGCESYEDFMGTPYSKNTNIAKGLDGQGWHQVSDTSCKKYCENTHALSCSDTVLGGFKGTLDMMDLERLLTDGSMDLCDMYDDRFSKKNNPQYRLSDKACYVTGLKQTADPNCNLIARSPNSRFCYCGDAQGDLIR